MPIIITSNWPLLVVMSVVARWRSTFSSRITQLSLMSGFAFSNAGESFFSSIMSGLFNMAIVTVAAEALAAEALAAAAHPTAPTANARSAVLKARFMTCLLYGLRYGGPSQGPS
ncbi:Secreted protein [Paraburkholderia kururiensis]